MDFHATGTGPTMAAAQADAERKVNAQIRDHQDHEDTLKLAIAGMTFGAILMHYGAKILWACAFYLGSLALRPLPTMIYTAICVAFYFGFAGLGMGIEYMIGTQIPFVLALIWFFIGFSIACWLVMFFHEHVSYLEQKEIALYRVLPPLPRLIAACLSCAIPVALLYGFFFGMSKFAGIPFNSVFDPILSVPRLFSEATIIMTIVSVVWAVMFLTAISRRIDIWKMVAETETQEDPYQVS